MNIRIVRIGDIYRLKECEQVYINIIFVIEKYFNHRIFY